MAEHLTKNTFIEKIHDYEKNKEWQYKGTIPSLIDFYADWCAPCRMLAPVMDELSKEYEGKINVYKINVDQEPELTNVFEIGSIPTMLFIPLNGKPQIKVGAYPKDALKKNIRDILGVS